MTLKNDGGRLRDAHLAWSEAEFQQAVIDLAHSRGWLVAHFRPARTSKGWRTAITGDPGFPDLVLARNGPRGGCRVLFIELKTETGRWTEAQQVWARRLPGYALFRPRDWPRIERLLE